MAEPLNATFFALRRRERRGVLLRATLALVLFGALLVSVLAVIFSWIMGVSLNGLWQASIQGGFEPSSDPARALWLFPLMFIWAFLYAVLLAAYESACLRWMIRGEVRGLWGLTVDDDAWRVYGAYWVWSGVFLVWILAYWIAWALFTRLLGDGHWGVWLALGLLSICVLFSVVSLAPATATIIAKRRFTFFEALEVSDNRFAALLGSFIILVGGQWLLQNGMNVAWWSWTLGPSWLEYFGDANDYMSFARAEQNVSSAAMQASGATIWAIMIIPWVVSMIAMVLVFGVNARAVLAALDEGKIELYAAKAV